MNRDEPESESRNLRNNYRQAVREDSDNESKNTAQTILYTSFIIYIILLVMFVLALYHYATFRFYCFEVLSDISEDGSIKGAIFIGVIGYVFVLTGFNVVLFDIMVGFLLKPYWYGLLVVSLAKFLAKYTGFCIGRYCIRDFIYRAMSTNIYFIVCYLAAEQRPVKLMFSIQFMAIPTLFKTYACGLFKISHWEYTYPTIFGTVVWCAFWCYVGYSLDSLIGVLQSGDTSSFVPLWVKILMLVILVVIIIYFFHVTRNIYNDIKEYANLSEIIENPDHSAHHHDYDHQQL